MFASDFTTNKWMVLMSRTLVAGLAAALILAAAPAVRAEYASGRNIVAEAAAKKLVERRIDIIKTTLGLTPDQQKLWPAVEDAIRTQAATRHDRVAKLIAQRDSDDDVSVIELMRGRADALAQKAAALKKLADAWQPLYAKLEDHQKERLAFLAAYAMREFRDAAARRYMAADEEADDDEY